MEHRQGDGREEIEAREADHEPIRTSQAEREGYRAALTAQGLSPVPRPLAD